MYIIKDVTVIIIYQSSSSVFPMWDGVGTWWYRCKSGLQHICN